jgi:hypothetical protein
MQVGVVVDGYEVGVYVDVAVALIAAFEVAVGEHEEPRGVFAVVDWIRAVVPEDAVAEDRGAHLRVVDGDGEEHSAAVAGEIAAECAVAEMGLGDAVVGSPFHFHCTAVHVGEVVADDAGLDLALRIFADEDAAAGGAQAFVGADGDDDAAAAGQREVGEERGPLVVGECDDAAAPLGNDHCGRDYGGVRRMGSGWCSRGTVCCISATA